MKVTKEIVDRFLSWPLPDSVCSDLCVTKRDYGKEQGWPKRVGTNLLTHDEAQQMLEYVLSTEQAEQDELMKRVDAFLEHTQEHGLTGSAPNERRKALDVMADMVSTLLYQKPEHNRRKAERRVRNGPAEEGK